MNNYRKNKALAIFRNTQPSMTDQSQANDTDINVIVKRYGVTGTAPGSAKQPIYEDFSEMPSDLREMLEQTKDVRKLRNRLPEQLKEMPVAELLALTPQKLRAILKPADKPKDEKPEDEKK